ncbi:MAG TPA: 3-methyl-2-oxobutanoate hydroxymethyltransferase [Candidatus Limnocylindrales bacterium]
MSAQTQSARLTIADITKLYADGQRFPMLTAYDYATAKLVDEAGVPIILVGDSLATVFLGYDSEIRITVDQMLHHTAAVVRGTKRAVVVGDLPFLSYATPAEAVENAGRFLREAGAQAVKLEGGVRSARQIEAVVKAGIPIMGHIGWTPQSKHVLGGKVRVQGKSLERARALVADAFAVQEAGAFAVVLELVPDQLARALTERLSIPTIGIGAGPGCSAEVQVITDLLGWSDWHPRHAKPYANLRETILGAVREYAAEVEAGTFPGPEQTSSMDDATLEEVFGRSRLDRADSVDLDQLIPLDRDL